VITTTPRKPLDAMDEIKEKFLHFKKAILESK
jgi:hypothetical protein